MIACSLRRSGGFTSSAAAAVADDWTLRAENRWPAGVVAEVVAGSAATGEGADLLGSTYIGAGFKNDEGASEPGSSADPGLIVSKATDARKVANDFIAAIAQHRHWDREAKGDVPA